MNKIKEIFVAIVLVTGCFGTTQDITADSIRDLATRMSSSQVLNQNIHRQLEIMFANQIPEGMQEEYWHLLNGEILHVLNSDVHLERYHCLDDYMKSAVLSFIGTTKRTPEDLRLIMKILDDRVKESGFFTFDVQSWFGYDTRSLQIILKLKSHLLDRDSGINCRKFGCFYLLKELMKKEDAAIDELAAEIETASTTGATSEDIDAIFSKHTQLPIDVINPEIESRFISDGLVDAIESRKLEFASKVEKKVLVGAGHAMQFYYLDQTRIINGEYYWGNDWFMVDIDSDKHPDLLGDIYDISVMESLRGHLGEIDIFFHEGLSCAPTNHVNYLKEGGFWLGDFEIFPEETQTSLMEKFPGFSRVILINNFGNITVPPDMALKHKDPTGHRWIKFESKETLLSVFEYNALSFPVGVSMPKAVFGLAIK